MDARATYTEGARQRAREADGHEARSRTLGAIRLLVMAGVLVLLGWIVFGKLPSSAWIGEIALVLTFAVLVVVHARVVARKERAQAAQRFYERGLLRLDHDWAKLPPAGERFRGADHPFADDLDVFGAASLFQLVDTTETRFGEARLAALLTRSEIAGFPDEVRERQRAVKDLAPRVTFRERLSALGALLGAEKPDPEPFLRWVEGNTSFRADALVLWVARILPAIAVGLAIASRFDGRLQTPLFGVLLGVLGVTLLVRSKTSRIAGMVSAREAGFARYAEMLAALEEEKLEAPLLKKLQERLRATGTSARREMAALARIISSLDARNNEVFRFVIGPFLLWDLNCVVALERWRLRTHKDVRAWFDVLGEFEALSGLSAFAFERPAYAWPELAGEPTYRAEKLGHPLIREGKRVDNDFTLERAGVALIVTGSNMSGKSTLLRAVGLNAVLANAGAPVCAKSLVIGPVRVVTSMRVKDSLEEGVSHFYAEVKRLKQVLDMARDGKGTVLFLLDEILHGTNSRERILGARGIIKELVARGAMGAVSTHDLGISDLDRELSTATNVHFQEQVEGDRMTFDYQLRQGVVQSSNALRLMRMVGIDVAVDHQ